eukprot:TRINITY_DN66947_c0_g1_i1.p1 TRINITY_DN66947_c0_g1~~TRINITY_DN66947_c0_g1_i1.p1  ORF type:complete len:324 (+),score=43.05 TRINITY_DN66947_c0_g1_i1:112-1083(+)
MELGGHVVINLKGTDTTPSLLYNNLSCHGSLCAFVHKNDAVLADITKPDAPAISRPLSQSQWKIKAAVYQAKLAHVGSRLLLLVATTSTLQFWDAEKETFLGSVACPDERDVYLSRGIAVLPGKGESATVFLGHSNGSLSVIDYQSDEQTMVKNMLRHVDNISDVCCGDTDGCGTVVASADISGELVLWSEDLSELAKAFFQGDTLSSLHIFGPFVVGGFGSGLIRLFNVKDCTLYCEIGAHARWITALCVDPARSLMASVGEDMLLCVWRLPCKENSGKVQLVGHKLLKDCILTGCSFSDDGRRVLASAYDWDKLHVLDVGR